LSERSVALAEANRLDIAAAPGYGLSDAAVDRLRLTPQRIAELAKAWKKSPLCPNRSAKSSLVRFGPAGWKCRRCERPLGVIFFIYESRPECDGRRRRTLRQGGQRRDPARRQRAAIPMPQSPRSW